MNQHQLNEKIKALILQKEADGEQFTDADKKLIKQYEGSGGQSKHGAKGEGVLYEFYTPDYIVDLMWDLARRYGLPTVFRFSQVPTDILILQKK